MKREENYGKIVEWLTNVANGKNSGYTDTIVIGEIVYAFLSRGLDDEAVKTRTYIEGIPNLTIIEEIPISISHRSAELKKKVFQKD